MIQRITTRITREPLPILVKEIDIMNDMSIPDNLLNPLLITEEFVEGYLSDITSKNLYELQDDLLMIWLAMPETGYDITIKPLISKLRIELINEINNRPPAKSKPRLEYRLRNQNIVC